MIKINLVKNFDSKASKYIFFFQRPGLRVFFFIILSVPLPYVKFKNYRNVLHSAFQTCQIQNGLTFSHHHKKDCPTYFVRAYNLFKRKNFSLLFNSAADDNESSCPRCHVLFFWCILNKYV